MDWKKLKVEEPEPKEPTVGRPKAIKSPAHLWNLACDYFASIDEEPFVKKDFIRGGNAAGTIVDIPTQRPYTWQGFDNYVFFKDIIWDLKAYRNNTNGNYAEFSPIIARIDSIIYNQKFEGAAVGAFHHAIIARDLGLTDKVEQTIKEQPLFPEEDTGNKEVSDEDVADLL
jgi:hypothetical protein